MSAWLLAADCPECRGAQTVILGSCCVCFAEFSEADDLDPELGTLRALLVGMLRETDQHVQPVWDLVAFEGDRFMEG